MRCNYWSKMATVDKEENTDSGKLKKTKRSIEFSGKASDKTGVNTMDKIQEETVDGDNKSNDNIVQIQEKDARPGDKRLAPTPEHTMAKERHAKQGKTVLISDDSYAEGNITSVLESDISLTSSDQSLAEKLDTNMSVSDLEETHIQSTTAGR